ncbi:MAG: metallophosphoesterase, partial [Pseudomonadota bacterium]
MPLLPDARPPSGLRLYAIGDVHGCLDKLKAVYGLIDADLARDPPPDWRLIHLGDYIDRGPRSRSVVTA